ncbi:MAG: AAA family ATPase [Myxococcota bacterium]|jgi:predicted ATPase|nr:AAA family ATPase [Myxococcota bacterium]
MIREITLQGFKSFRRAKAQMGALTLIVGTNASGKSNIREALRFLHGVGLNFSIPEILGEKYGPGGILQWRGIRGGANEAGFQGGRGFTIEARIEVPPASRKHRAVVYSYRIEVDLSDRTTGPRVAKERLRRGVTSIFDSHPGDDPIEQRGEHQIRVRLPRGGTHRRSGKALEFSSSKPVLSQFADRTKETGATACADVVKVLQSIRFLDLDPDAMRIASQPGQVVLGDRGENLSSVLMEICQDEQRKQTLLEWLRALTPMDATDFTFRTEFSGRVLVHLKEASGFEVSAHSASDGTLRFLALIAALLSQDSGQIYFFEEFDNGIHPTRLHLLLDLVSRAAVVMNVQVIGTTHNPALLAFLDEDARSNALLVYRDDRGLESRLLRIMSLPDAGEILKKQDLGRLHQAGWLEDAAAFSAEDDEEVV